MANIKKDQQAILDKLGINQLNQMQMDAQKVISTHYEVVLLSPTGTGKTLAFILPIVADLDVTSNQIQVLIIVPSRELALQIEQVTREMGSGYRTIVVYGGRAGHRDKIDLKHPPAILIGTPGRIADHIRRQNISVQQIKTLVLDEFDKSLEVGFEKEMKEIVNSLPNLKKKILTSATQKLEIPEFLKLNHPKKLNYPGEKENQLNVKVVNSPTRDKLETLQKLLGHLSAGNGIVFCNFKDTIQIVSSYLNEKKFRHACFHGGLEQMDRERALIKFRNGTHQILIATDLAARGIDVPELDFVIHFQLPGKLHEFIHRNGRTARMHSKGIAYIIKWDFEHLPEFVGEPEVERLSTLLPPAVHKWETLYISGGKRDKISKGDIAGMFMKQGQAKKEELGIIEIKQEYSFVAVSSAKTKELIRKLDNQRLKKKKVRISLLE